MKNGKKMEYLYTRFILRTGGWTNHRQDLKFDVTTIIYYVLFSFSIQIINMRFFITM